MNGGGHYWRKGQKDEEEEEWEEEREGKVKGLSPVSSSSSSSSSPGLFPFLFLVRGAGKQSGRAGHSFQDNSDQSSTRRFHPHFETAPEITPKRLPVMFLA